MVINSEEQAVDQATNAARFLLWERILVSTREPRPYCLISFHQYFGEVFAMWLLRRVTTHYAAPDDSQFCAFILFYEAFVAKPVIGTLFSRFISDVVEEVYFEYGLAQVKPSRKLKRTQVVADPFRLMVETLVK